MERMQRIAVRMNPNSITKDHLLLLPSRALHLSRWVVKSACRAMNLIHTLHIFVLLFLCIIMPMIGTQLLFKDVSMAIVWLMRASGAWLKRRLCNAVRFVTLVTAFGLGALLIHALNMTWTERYFSKSKRRKKKKEGDTTDNTEINGPAALNFNADDESNYVNYEVPALNFSRWLFDYAEGYPLSSSTCPTNPYKELEIDEANCRTSDESAAINEVQDILCNRPITSRGHSRSRSYTNCGGSSPNAMGIDDVGPQRSQLGLGSTELIDRGPYSDVPLISHDAQVSTSRKTRSTSKSCDWGSSASLVSTDQAKPPLINHGPEPSDIDGDPRADLHSPPLPPLELILQENDLALHVTLQRRSSLIKRALKQSLAPWRQNPAAASSTALDIVSSPANYQYYITLSDAADPGSDTSREHGVDDLHAQSDAFISRWREEWRLQRLKSLQRAAESN